MWLGEWSLADYEVFLRQEVSLKALSLRQEDNYQLAGHPKGGSNEWPSVVAYDRLVRVLIGLDHSNHTG